MQTIHADMRTFCLDDKFDCIIAWHSFFHLTREDQRKMFVVFKKYIKANGALVFTSGIKKGEVWSDNGGEQFYHASLNEDEYREQLKQHGFEVICYKSEDPTCGDATVWMARKL